MDVVSSHMYRTIGTAVSLIVCDKTRKKMPFMGLESHTFCYPDRGPEPVRLEEKSNHRSESEFIIADVNRCLYRCSSGRAFSQRILGTHK